MAESRPVETGGKRVQVLAYIDKVIAPPNPEHVADDVMPNQPIGYVCDVSVYVRDGMKFGIAEHYGDGVIRKTFEDAQQYIWEHTRVMVEPIAGAEEPAASRPGSRPVSHVSPLFTEALSHQRVEAGQSSKAGRGTASHFPGHDCHRGPAPG